MSKITVQARLYNRRGVLQSQDTFTHEHPKVAKADVEACLQFGVKICNIMVRRDGKLISYKDL
ncbi:hypothetical protein PQC38_gp052 [Aeromonas phage BUCT695]|uniref:hypothetical protein n=1 Tax=Aeromonas phage BUCT695 TaxID=2908630 RepID=UPI00232954EF|nr:hypothetical protein PQC38_gp052 [Aeromonas phage BUCT695]UIW10528.1 hypothetical protein [Aeromonas phage BUCT695]